MLPDQDKLRADDNHRRVRGIIKALVQDCQNRPPSDEDAGSIAGHLLRLRDGRGRPLTTDRLVEEFEIFFIAGSETTGHTVAWTLYALFFPRKSCQMGLFAFACHHSMPSVGGGSAMTCICGGLVSCTSDPQLSHCL